MELVFDGKEDNASLVSGSTEKMAVDTSRFIDWEAGRPEGLLFQCCIFSVKYEIIIH